LPVAEKFDEAGHEAGREEKNAADPHRLALPGGPGGTAFTQEDRGNAGDRSDCAKHLIPLGFAQAQEAEAREECSDTGECGGFLEALEESVHICSVGWEVEDQW
jgi:general stress protein YciG